MCVPSTALDAKEANLYHALRTIGRLAQLDRASASGAEGRGFESRIAHDTHPSASLFRVKFDSSSHFCKNKLASP